MTNIQAINLLKGLEQSLDDYCELNDEGKTAFGMAITTLELFGNSEQLPSAQPEKRTEERMETHACDLIDREAAVDAIYHHLPSVSRTRARTMLHEVPSAQPEPCEDAVSRKMAMDAITASTPYCVVPDDYHISVVDMEFRISTLPSVTPERKTGKWTEDNACPFCGFQPWYERDIHTLSFCPNCGARMTKEDV